MWSWWVDFVHDFVMWWYFCSSLLETLEEMLGKIKNIFQTFPVLLCRSIPSRCLPPAVHVPLSELHGLWPATTGSARLCLRQSGRRQSRGPRHQASRCRLWPPRVKSGSFSVLNRTSMILNIFYLLQLSAGGGDCLTFARGGCFKGSKGGVDSQQPGACHLGRCCSWCAGSRHRSRTSTTVSLSYWRVQTLLDISCFYVAQSSSNVTPPYPPEPGLTLSSTLHSDLPATPNLITWANESGYSKVTSCTEADLANRFVIQLTEEGAGQATSVCQSNCAYYLPNV